jgi:hypothetical protein
MTCNVIATGSGGNAVVLNDNIMIDCGVPFRELEGVYKSLSLVLLTHIHGDHFNPDTIKRLHFMRPSLRFCCGEWLYEHLVNIGISESAIDCCDATIAFRYGVGLMIGLDVIPHDVMNCAWRVWAGEEKAFYATDCASLDSVTAKGYDLYLIEANYGENELLERQERKLAEGKFSYEARAAASHLSEEQATAWLNENAETGKSKVLFLHRHIQEEA